MLDSQHTVSTHRRPSPSQQVDLRSTIIALQREVESHGVGPCLVRISRKRGWPDPTPITEVIVQAGDVAMLTRNKDPKQAVLRAFQAVLDRLE